MEFGKKKLIIRLIAGIFFCSLNIALIAPISVKADTCSCRCADGFAKSYDNSNCMESCNSDCPGTCYRYGQLSGNVCLCNSRNIGTGTTLAQCQIMCGSKSSCHLLSSISTSCECYCGRYWLMTDSTGKCGTSCPSEWGGGTSTCSSGTNNSEDLKPVNFTPQIGIPGSDFQAGKAYDVGADGKGSTKAIAEYIKAIYKFLIGIVSIVACIMLMVGGVSWLTAGGSPEKVKNAQDIIKGSLAGLFLALGSFFILGTINPALVNFNVMTIKSVTPAPNLNDKKTDCLKENTPCGTWPVKSGSTTETCCKKCCGGACVKGGYSYGKDEAKCMAGLGY